MKKLLITLLGIISFNDASFAYDISNLQSKIETVKSECSGIKSSLDTIFGLSVATTVSSGLGTVTATGALVAGLKKSNQDYKLDEETLHNNIDRFIDDFDKLTEDIKNSMKIEDIKNSMKKSETLGNVRSALLAGTTVTSAVSTGTSIGATLTAEKLAEKMSSCNKSLQALKMAKLSLENEIATEGKNDSTGTNLIATTQNILSSCTGFDEANIKTLKNIATANAVVSGIGTGVSGVGTATSIMANKSKDKEKNKKLNTTSNVLAGVAIGTSATSTTLSALQISKAKKDSDMAERCENSL